MSYIPVSSVVSLLEPWGPVRRVFAVLAACLFGFGWGSGCSKRPINPADGPIEGNTEVAIFVEECGDHRGVKKVLFGDVAQSIVSQKDDEVKIRTSAAQGEGDVPVKLVMTNNQTCDTGLSFSYRKMEQQSINYLLDQGHPMGERRVGGWVPGSS